jgi:hypothetical protein
LAHLLRSLIAAFAVTLCASAFSNASEKPNYSAIIDTAEALSSEVAMGNLSSSTVSALEAFAVLARRTASAIDAAGEAADLACIYRGMAEDITLRLGNAKAGDPHAMDDLKALLQDAIDVTPHTQEEAEPMGPGLFICEMTGADPFDLDSILH